LFHRATKMIAISRFLGQTPSQARTGLFDREARALYSINHSGVVTLLDHDVDARRGDVLVLTPVPGRNLRELLDKRLPKPLH
jgi:serine/threonine protein kinase